MGKKDWDEQMAEVKKYCADTTTSAVQQQLSPVKRALDYLTAAYTPTATKVSKNLMALDEGDTESDDDTPVTLPKKRKVGAGGSISQKKRGDYLNPDQDSLFTYVPGYEKGGNSLNWRVYMSVIRLNTGEELKKWIAKHMKEESPRELAYLFDLADTRKMDVGKRTTRGGLIKKLVADYDAAADSL